MLRHSEHRSKSLYHSRFVTVCRGIAFLCDATHSPPRWERQAKIPLFRVFLHSEKSQGETMNRTLTKFFQALSDRRFRTTFLAGAVLGMLFAASGAKAGCAVPYKAGAAPAIPFISPHSDGESKEHEHGTIVGLWHVIYTGETDTNFPPGGPV